MTTDRAKWAAEVLKKADDKLKIVAKRNVGKIPYTTIDGCFDNRFPDDKYCWTNGFWSGILWILYERTKDENYLACAGRIEEMMDEALFGDTEEGLHHDVGFMWLHISVAHYRLTGDLHSRRRGLIAAKFLTARFNPQGGYIVAWNGPDKQGWSIIDSMMNIPLLYWAAEETGYDRYRAVARAHADKTLENAIRPDGSVIHIIEYDPQNGEMLGSKAGQGYAVGSSWTRGHAWAIYGFALSYRRTKDERYLMAAKRVAHYFVAALSEDCVPVIDFRSPDEPDYKDTTAGAIAACGLLEIAEHVPQLEKKLYDSAAIKLLMALETHYCNWDIDHDAILSHGTEAYHDPARKHIDIIYGDYFFLEAVARLDGMKPFLW